MTDTIDKLDKLDKLDVDASRMEEYEALMEISEHFENIHEIINGYMQVTYVVEDRELLHKLKVISGCLGWVRKRIGQNINSTEFPHVGEGQFTRTLTLSEVFKIGERRRDRALRENKKKDIEEVFQSQKKPGRTIPGLARLSGLSILESLRRLRCRGAGAGDRSTL